MASFSIDDVRDTLHADITHLLARIEENADALREGPEPPGGREGPARVGEGWPNDWWAGGGGDLALGEAPSAAESSGATELHFDDAPSTGGDAIRDELGGVFALEARELVVALQGHLMSLAAD